MQPRALIMALMATGTLTPAVVQAQSNPLRPEDSCPVMVVYAVTQVCNLLSNGLTQCQPVGVVGPAPNCPNAGLQPLMPMPLSPPVIQPPTTTGRPYGPPAATNPFAIPQSTWPFGQMPYAIPYAGYAPRPMAIPQAGIPFGLPVPMAAAPAATAGKPVVPDQPAAAKPTQAPAAPEPVAAPTPSPRPPVVAGPETQPPAAPVAQPLVAADTQPAPAATPAATPEPAQPAPAAMPVPHPTPSAPAEAPTARQIEDALAHFDFDSATLTDKGRALLDAWLAQYPRDTPVRVTGHADRLGPEPYNLKLSQRRAEAVRQYLLDHGVEAKSIEIVAKGEREPVKACKGGANPATKACLAPNRRVVIDPE
jgi:outer membrane protein OmpA-like peptidoglycan-associated protein